MKTKLIKTDINILNIDITLETKLLIPSIKAKGIVVHHHGTIFSDEQSVLNIDMYEYVFSKVVNMGYIVLLPGYVGFGSSKNLVHPYHIDKLLSLNSYLLLKEAIKHIDQAPKKLYITGYSEGAYIGYSLLKNYEDKLSKQFYITTILGAGLYDVAGSINSGLRESTYPNPELISYLLYAYAHYYRWDLGDIFNAEHIPIIIDAFKNKYQPYDLPQELNQLLTHDFLIDTPQKIKEVLKDNTIVNYIPNSEVILYHSSDDEVVSVDNTLTLYNNLKDKTTVTKILDKNLNHIDASVEYFEVLFNKLVHL